MTLDLLAVIQHPDVVGDQWRVVQPFRRLAERGHRARWICGPESPLPPTDPERTVLVARMLAGTDETAIDRWFRSRRPHVKAIVYELDDAIWSEATADHLEAADFLQGRTREQLDRQGELALSFARRCDGVIASSEPLAEQVRRDIGAPVVVAPNGIDVEWFRARLAPRPEWAENLTIGWSGGRRPEDDVAPMAEAWGRIARRYPEVRFVVASPLVPDVIYRHVDDERIIRLGWVPWDESPTIYQTDIGCVAVAATPFNACKTPIKAWEYGLAGAAVVGTSLLYGPVINDPIFGRFGYLANTADEWESALAWLVTHPDERDWCRRRFAVQIEQQYSLEATLDTWVRAYQQLADQRTEAIA